ncbi:MAG: sigma-70 family RNA polymerase sigma factor [Actinobacteria bacterium]|nr:sigma-70 family RNA polymerase sigma factor [Actinomycetota bacterium]
MKAGAIKADGTVPAGISLDRSNVVEFPRSRKVECGNEELVDQYQQTKDSKILEKIVAANQGLLHATLKRFSYFPDPYEDLLQVANLGLIKAIQRFDKSNGAGFSSYATAIVDGEVRHHLRDSVLMRQPRWLRKTEKRIEEVSIEFTRKHKRPPTLTELSEAVNISEDGILEIMRVYASVSLHSVDDPITRERLQSGPDASVVCSRHYESFSLPIEDRIVLEDAIEALSAFQKKIVYLLFYKDLTQAEVAEEMGLSQRKVSRESAKALDRLKAILNTKIF